MLAKFLQIFFQTPELDDNFDNKHRVSKAKKHAVKSGFVIDLEVIDMFNVSDKSVINQCIYFYAIICQVRIL